MFGFLKKEEFISLGVNRDADFSSMSSIMIALFVQNKIKTNAYLKEEIIDLQKQFDEHKLGFKDVFNDFIWISRKSGKNLYELVDFRIYTVVSGIKEEFEKSELHLELLENHIFSCYKSFSVNSGMLEMDISKVQMDYWEKGVKYPSHFERSIVNEKTFKVVKTNATFRTIEIEKIVGAKSDEEIMSI